MLAATNGARNMLARLHDEELKDLSSSMAHLGRVTPEVTERILIEFIDRIGRMTSVTGSLSTAEQLLRLGLPDSKVIELMRDIRDPSTKTMWERLASVSPDSLTNFLRNEHPQTSALILSRINSVQAAEVLSNLPVESSFSILMRILRLDNVQDEVVDNLEVSLRNEFTASLNETQHRDLHELLADIFNHFDRSTEVRLMSRFENEDNESAERVKSLMFTFEDLIRVASAGVQQLIRLTDKDTLTMALKGAQPRLLELFLSNMSDRAARIVSEDMSALGAVRLQRIEDAQSQVVQLARELEESGDIDIAPRGRGQNSLVY